MRNPDLAKKIKGLRSRKGLSQEELAEVSQLSLRTVQRIESGETTPRGDTLKRIAYALEVNPDELIVQAEQEDNGFLAFMNLSALSFIAFPLLGIVVPLGLWIWKKDKISRIDEAGKKLLNFQISWCVLLLIIYILIFDARIFRVVHGIKIGNLGGPEQIVLSVFILYLINLILIVFNTVRSLNNKSLFYQPAKFRRKALNFRTNPYRCIRC